MQKESNIDSNGKLPVYEAEIIPDGEEQGKAVSRITNDNNNFSVSKYIGRTASVILGALEVFKRVTDVFGKKKTEKMKHGKRTRKRSQGKD